VFTGPGRHPVAGEIVVGAGDDDQALAALEFGFGEADLRGARLTAVHTWAHPRAGWPDNYDDWILSVGPLGEGAAPLLAGQVAPWRLKYPGVSVSYAMHAAPSRSSRTVLLGEVADRSDPQGVRGDGESRIESSGGGEAGAVDDP
jgi:hypothetical protein